MGVKVYLTYPEHDEKLFISHVARRELFDMESIRFSNLSFFGAKDEDAREFFSFWLTRLRYEDYEVEFVDDADKS